MRKSNKIKLIKVPVVKYSYRYDCPFCHTKCFNHNINEDIISFKCDYCRKPLVVAIIQDEVK